MRAERRVRVKELQDLENAADQQEQMLKKIHEAQVDQNKRLNDIESQVKDLERSLVDEIKKPSGLVSKIIFRIPIVGSILRMIVK